MFKSPVNLRALARDEACIRCGRIDGTVVLAHYTGPRQHSFGKGTGTKGHDAVGAYLCRTCHDWFDSYRGRNTVERSEEFLFLCCMTMVRVWEKLNETGG